MINPTYYNFLIQVLNVLPFRLSLQLLPILLHLDQRHIDFLTSFFSSSPSTSPQELHLGYEEIFFPQVAGMEDMILDEKVPEATEDPLLPFFQVPIFDCKFYEEKISHVYMILNLCMGFFFFQMCELKPFSIRVDYVPRRIDIGALSGGNYAELFNLVSWKAR